jgi:hypothetical protein
MDDPKMTRFRAMSLDEQMKKIEQPTQEALRAKEEIKVTEATKLPLLAPVKNKGFPMTQDA